MGMSDADGLDLEARHSLEFLLEQARVRLELPRLMAAVLDRDPKLVHQAIRDWAARTRPLGEIADVLRRAREG